MIWALTSFGAVGHDLTQADNDPNFRPVIWAAMEIWGPTRSVAQNLLWYFHWIFAELSLFLRYPTHILHKFKYYPQTQHKFSGDERNLKGINGPPLHSLLWAEFVFLAIICWRALSLDWDGFIWEDPELSSILELLKNLDVWPGQAVPVARRATVEGRKWRKSGLDHKVHRRDRRAPSTVGTVGHFAHPRSKVGKWPSIIDSISSGYDITSRYLMFGIQYRMLKIWKISTSKVVLEHSISIQ
jgi:hypothetical protein